MKRLKLKVGDIIEIPINDNLVGYGQIVCAGKVLYVVIFEEAYPKAKRIDIQKVVAGKILLVGHTLDGRLYHGMWKVIGNVPIDTTRIPFPCYKLELGSEGMVVVDFDGTVMRKANKQEEDLLTFRTTRAPIGFEHALQAKHGIRPWDPDDEQLTLEFVKNRVMPQFPRLTSISDRRLVDRKKKK
ncbi:MAG: Imm26 family immunity protein [Nitrospira sp.]